jgi:pimeloyl-ACP methyl ester carboxylesterase
VEHEPKEEVEGQPGEKQEAEDARVARLDLDGITFGYDDAGTGSPPIVFLHGWACDRTFWAPQFANLSRDHRCIAIDSRGRGDSEAIPPYDTETAADDVAAVMRALAVGPAVIAGHSLGGLVALLLNDRYPELVLGIVLGDSPLTSSSGGGLAQTVKVVKDAGSMEAVRPLVERFFIASTPPEVRAKVEQTMLGCPADVGAGMLSNAEVFTRRMGDLLKQADEKPFMAIWEAARPLGNAERLREIAPFVRQEPIDAGHFFQLELPDVTNALLRAFLDDVANDPRINRQE